MTERIGRYRENGSDGPDSRRRPCAYQTVLAIGGELKNAFCVRVGQLYYLSPYIGDMEDLRTVQALRETVQRFLTLLEVQPQAIICDRHPGYHTAAVAQELAEEMQIPLYRIQHHYAHVLSCMAENDETGPVIGISLDGTGYGDDGSIWGGELLLADTDGYVRAGSIKPFRQVGGDTAAREGRRIAVSMIHSLCKENQRDRAGEEAQRIIAALGLCTEQEAAITMKMADAGMNTADSTSCGRLFDAVSAILGIRLRSTFEGEASMALQFAAERGRQARMRTGAAPFPRKRYEAVTEEGRLVLATDRLFADLLRDRLDGADTDLLAYRFHEGLAELLTDACRAIRRQEGTDRVALTGGCFQNTLLLALVEEKLSEEGFTVLRHRQVPPNDGGLALGQAAWTGHKDRE